MKKTVALRIKHDREYSQKLLNLVAESVKMEAPSYHSSLYKVGGFFPPQKVSKSLFIGIVSGKTYQDLMSYRKQII